MKRGNRWMVVLAAVTMLMGLLAGPAAAQYPQVVPLRAFSPEANYMSVPGYLRYVVFVQNGAWIGRQEAVRIVKQQHDVYYAQRGR